MPEQAPEGYTHIEDAVAVWGRHRAWWYERVREGDVQGYKFPGIRGTYLRNEEVEQYITTPEVKRRADADHAAM